MRRGGDLPKAALETGLDLWPRVIGDAERRGMAAVSQGAIPGATKVSTDGMDMERAVIPAIVGGPIACWYTRQQEKKTTAGRPTLMKQTPSTEVPEERPDATPASPAKPSEAVLAEDRRIYILDGDGRGNSGHGAGRATAGKSEFPSDWSDKKTIDAIKDVANDPNSVRAATKMWTHGGNWD